jgi:hypothetical protein
MSTPGPSLDTASVTFMLTPRRKRTLPVREVSRIPFEQVLPVREFPSYREQQNLHVFASFTKMDTLIPCESLREREYVKLADFEGDVERLAAQPFRVDWVCQDGTARSAVPDFFVRLIDGRARLVDITSERRLVKPHEVARGDLLREFCFLAGWEYVVHTEWGEAFRANLLALDAFRSPPFGVEAYAAAVVAACRERPQAFAELSALGVPALVRPVIFHLLWKRRLRVEMGVAWTNATTVALAQAPGGDLGG